MQGDYAQGIACWHLNYSWSKFWHQEGADNENPGIRIDLYEYIQLIISFAWLSP
jgi:hypothetical protein